METIIDELNKKATPSNRMQSGSSYAPSDSYADLVKIVDISAKVTEKTDIWWRFAWRLILKNSTNRLVKVDATIEFQDEDGFAIADENEYNIVLRPEEEKTVTGFSLISMPGARNVSKYKSKISLKP